ncbi:homeobox protein 5-like isoform X1 [Lucilia cuprina]|uniref:homeobox protein 5-like isoform X1 n=1 Tax=Lucilia cuprina TaxID=7375 RepID=UPI001F05933A|nr:homeobox protein 5-like isoform X1 [Lucilia cuprina]XP_046801084.1 homeobox protein 5-like isoform X1 [Lucilia cuprina]XP_046801085.1 homeobox protein 5-like isoform X1 [Lucilia cuprina]XP_046801086.1 homeobox protein 5-like isoform X1 [Lucilia cuprina]
MNDLRRSVESARFQQKQTSHESNYRSSCSSTPEPQKQSINNKATANGPIDHPNMSSTSGGSTTSTTATTNTIGRSSSYANENGNITSSTAEIQFDEREIYYVSPSKRKSSLSASQTPVLRSSLRACERLRSFSPTSAAAIAPSYPPIMPSAAYGARLSGTAGHDLSFDNYETSSHYSDTAMQVLRSGSCSAMTTMLNTNNVINNTSTAANNCHSSSSSLAQQQQQQHQPSQQTHLPPGQRLQNNVVTFSNHISEQRAATPQNRGSLRRGKGRSNQSLCSCDVGNDTELNPDPSRPLYEYSLERRHKGHTYTCEQNAQILLRLERERNRKLSLGGGSLSGGGGSREDLESDALSSSDAETIPPVPPPPAMKRNGSVRSLRLLQHLQQQQQSTLRSGTMCNGNQVANSSNKSHHNSNSNNNNSNSNNNGSIATLCSGDLLNDCAKSSHDVRAVIDDCTTSILKCANAMGSDIMSNTSTTTNGSYKTQVSTLNAMVSHSKPDVCHVTNTSKKNSLSANTSYFGNFPPPYAAQDDIILPKSQKSDPSLCFLHKTSALTGMGLGHVVPPPSSSASMAFTDFTQSQRDLQQKLQHYKNSSRLSLSKYNTIGPSSDYARQLAVYAQQQQLQHQQQQHTTQMKPFNERCRCFSKSWSNFSRDLMQTQCSNVAGLYHTNNHDNHSSLLHQQQQQPNFHASATSASSGKGRHHDKIPLRSSLSSRSFNNLVDIDTYNYDMASILSSHHKLHLTQQNTHQLACNGGSVGIGTGSGAILSQSNSTSGLKDNHMHGQASLKHQQQQQQHQLLQHHYQHTAHKDFHCDEHDNHHPLGMHGSTHLIKSSEKFHQHNHHHNTASNHHPPHHSSLTSIMPWKHRQSPSRGSSSSGTNSFRK